MNLRRYNDIVAVQTPEGIIAFHASNLEVAEISAEAFEHMHSIDLLSNNIPTVLLPETEASESLIVWDKELNANVKSGFVDYGIKSLTLNITQICNLKCTYCAAGGDGTYGDPVNKINVEKTLPQLKFFLEKLPARSSFNLSFVGGEPFLYPQAMKVIYDYVQSESALRNLDCKFMVTTNATLMSADVINMLSTMKIHVTVSLDGNDDINDHVRPSKDGTSSTALTLHGIKKLVSIRKSLASIGISAVFSQQNLKVKESYLFFKTLGADWYEFNFSYSEKNSEVQAEFLREMKEVAAIAWQTGGETELRKIKAFNSYFETLDSQQRIENFCGAGKSYLMIDAKNQLYVCPWVVGKKEEIVGSGNFIDSSKLTKYQKPLIELNNCQTCWARFLCGGGCMFINQTHSGDKHKKNDLFCERTRDLILLGIMYYKKARA